MKRIRIDYTVYPPNFSPGDGCWDFRTFQRAKSASRSLGIGARIYRNFNKRGRAGEVEDWWSGKLFWLWNGNAFQRRPGGDVNVTSSQA